MIQNKDDYYYYKQCDKLALVGENAGILRYIKDDIWRYQRTLRKAEYLRNCRKNLLGRIYYYLVKLRLRRLSFKLGFSIPENVFMEGLSIAHYGNIIVNPNVKIGKNCRIHVGVNIGVDARNGSEGVPKIGDNVYIAPGAKIFGNVVIGDNTVIGANAVVNQSFPEGNITIGGIPAQKISSRNSKDIIKWYQS